MSKIGKLPITIPTGITVEINDREVHIKNNKNSLVVPIPIGVSATVTGNEVQCTLERKTVQARSDWGTTRALIANAVSGLSSGFEKTLILEGVGFRITKDGDNLSFTLGFSHPVHYKATENIIFEVEKNSILKIRGFDRARVGQVAAEIRALKKPEPYKGTGFRYSDEIIQRKAGKKAASTQAGA